MWTVQSNGKGIKQGTVLNKDMARYVVSTMNFKTNLMKLNLNSQQI